MPQLLDVGLRIHRAPELSTQAFQLEQAAPAPTVLRCGVRGFGKDALSKPQTLSQWTRTDLLLVKLINGERGLPFHVGALLGSL